MKENGQEAERRDAFSFAAYQDSYVSPHRDGMYVGDNETHTPFAYRQELFREMKRRLEHGVCVDLLIQYVRIRLRVRDARIGEVRHG